MKMFISIHYIQDGYKKVSRYENPYLSYCSRRFNEILKYFEGCAQQSYEIQ